MKKFIATLCTMAVFAVASFATEGTLESAPKAEVKAPVKKEVKTGAERAAQMAADKAAMQANLVSQAELDKKFAKHDQAPAQKAQEEKIWVRDPNRSLDDPTGSCCYNSIGYYSCEEGLTENECLNLNGGFQWNEGLDCSVCPVTVYGGCCYDYFGYLYCYSNITEEECFSYYGGQSWTADFGGECDPAVRPSLVVAVMTIKVFAMMATHNMIANIMAVTGVRIFPAAMNHSAIHTVVAAIIIRRIAQATSASKLATISLVELGLTDCRVMLNRLVCPRRVVAVTTTHRIVPTRLLRVIATTTTVVAVVVKASRVAVA